MEALVRHLIEPIASQPEAISLQTVEGDGVVIMELVVHPDDKAVVEGEKGRTIRAVRSLLSAAAGRRKATIELVDEHGPVADEE
jgi:uncharacterized protein